MEKQETLIARPDDLKEHEETLMSNFDHTIDDAVANDLKGSKQYSQYAAWNFCGYVWWNEELLKWCCEIWQYHSHIETLIFDTLTEIMAEASDKYGYD